MYDDYACDFLTVHTGLTGLNQTVQNGVVGRRRRGTREFEHFPGAITPVRELTRFRVSILAFRFYSSVAVVFVVFPQSNATRIRAGAGGVYRFATFSKRIIISREAGN